MRKPFCETLYMQCLYEILVKAKQEGRESIDLKEVDDLVIKKAMAFAYKKVED